MTVTLSTNTAFQRQRGFWLRCFLGSLVVLLSCAVLAQALSCVSPGNLTVATVEGLVTDLSGEPLSGAVVSLTAESGAQLKATTATSGHFHFNADPGSYRLQAFVPNFQSIATTITVVPATSSSHARTLYILLGLHGSYCSTITTSKKQFDKTVRANKKRLKETAQKNATQK